jgi:hypothetical protein
VNDGFELDDGLETSGNEKVRSDCDRRDGRDDRV